MANCFTLKVKISGNIIDTIFIEITIVFSVICMHNSYKL
jgi:hypothetical protein